MLLTAPTCVLAIYASASACGIALVQLGDAGPSAGHPKRAHIVRTPQARGRAWPHTVCGDRPVAGIARVRAAVFVRSEKSNALVGDGVPQPAPRSANLDSAFGGMQLFAPEAWRAAPLLLTRSAQMAEPTVRLPQL